MRSKSGRSGLLISEASPSMITTSSPLSRCTTTAGLDLRFCTLRPLPRCRMLCPPRRPTSARRAVDPRDERSPSSRRARLGPAPPHASTEAAPPRPPERRSPVPACAVGLPGVPRLHQCPYPRTTWTSSHTTRRSKCRKGQQYTRHPQLHLSYRPRCAMLPSTAKILVPGFKTRFSSDSPLPGAGEHAEPVAVGELGEGLLIVAVGA